jgi:hypothetical protein
MESNEDICLGKFVFYDSRTFHDKVTLYWLEYVSCVGTEMLAFPSDRLLCFIKKNNTPYRSNITKPTQCSVSRVCNQVNRNYIPVQICSMHTKYPVRSLIRHNCQYNATSFRFPPLSTLYLYAHDKRGCLLQNFIYS